MSPRIFPLLEREFIDFLAKLGDPLTSEVNLPAAVDGWIRSGLARVVVRPASCSWMGVTYTEDRPRVMESIARLVGEGKYPSPLAEIGLVFGPAREMGLPQRIRD